MRSGFRWLVPLVVILIGGVWTLPADAVERTSAPAYVTHRWMSDLSNQLSDRRLVDVALPGTHDSATSAISANSGFAPDIHPALRLFDGPGPLATTIRGLAANWARTTDATIADQLATGIRYLDLRVCRNPDDNNLYACHGLYSHNLDTVLDEIASFAANRPSEILILDFNHFYEMREEDHQSLAKTIGETFGSALVDARQWSLDQVTVGQLWDQDQHVMVLYHHAAGRNQQPAFWPSHAIRSNWPNQRDLAGLKAYLDAEVNREKPRDQIWVLQGVRTEQAIDIILGILLPAFFPSSMESYAAWTTSAIQYWLRHDWLETNFNVIIVDYFENSGFADEVIGRNF